MSDRPTAGLVREVLPNGITLFAQRVRTAPAAAIATHVRAGFLDEPDDLVGISHVLEHLIFKGTATLPPGELARRTKALGGVLNAYTSYDRTVYYASLPARHAIEALALQAESVRNPLVDAEELRRELGVIVQEAKRKRDTPGAVAAETLHELLYDAHRLRRWRIGEEDRIAAFTREEVLGYHASRYVPSRTIAVMVADLDEAEMLDALRAAYGDWAGAVPAPAPAPAETSDPTQRTRTIEADVALAEVVLGWRAPAPLDPMAKPLDVAAAILANGRGARLPRLLRETGLVTGVSAGLYGSEDPFGGPGAGVFAISVETDPARLDAVLARVGGTLAALALHGPDADELARAVGLLRMRMRRQLERYESRAISLSIAEAAGDVTRLDREDAELAAVTTEAVREAVARVLVPTHASACASVPHGHATVLSITGLAAALAAPSDAMAPVALGSAPVTAPLAGPARRVIAHGVHHLAVGSLDILTARHAGAGQVSLGLYRRRPLLDTPDTAGHAILAMRTMLRGTEARGAAALALRMERLGGVLGPSVSGDRVGLGATVLAESAEDAAALLAEAAFRPRFDADDLAIERDLLREDARAITDDMVRFPFQLVLGAAFDDRGYGTPSFGTPASLDLADASAIRRWHATAFGAGRTTLVAVGDRDPAELADALAAAIGHVGDREATEPPDDPTLVTWRAAVRVEQRTRQQSALAMVFPGPSRRDPARHAAEVWAASAGGLGGTLFDALRDRRSLAYSVYAMSWQRRLAGGLLTYIACDPERLDEARAAMLEELAAASARPIGDGELARAVAMLSGQAEVARQTASAFAGEITDAWLLGDGLAELDAPGAAYRAVTAEDVHAVAAAAFDPARRAEGVVAASAAAPR